MQACSSSIPRIGKLSIVVCQLAHAHLIAINYQKQRRVLPIFKYTYFGNFEIFQLTNHFTEDSFTPMKLAGKNVVAWLNMIFDAVDEIDSKNN